MKAKFSKPTKSAAAARAARAPIEAEIEPKGPGDLLVTAIGASAGGLEASIELVKHLDPDTGLAFVLIQHLDPSHGSIIKDLLAKETSMPVTEVSDGTRVVANHIYVIPPNKLMTIEDHCLRLGPRGESRGSHMPIDHFMRILAEDLGNQAIGVILSGTGSDGMLGMAEIRARGGVTFAQEPATAKFDGMPRSAIAAGCVDHILRPQEIAAELGRLAHHPYVSSTLSAGLPPPAQPDGPVLNAVFQLLRRNTQVDFTYYRKTTILRRIQRRMLLRKIDSFSDYVKFLQTNSAEIKALHQDMLIHVTSFFRNPDVFEAMKRVVFPHMLKSKSADSHIRAWIPGCASGEEVYSLAIAMLEFLGSKAPPAPIQFFGTDVSETSVKTARDGVYPANIQGDVSAERLRRFFSKVEGGYRVNKNIRAMCIFAHHNLLSDPPFSRMDLICCRNLLIYFEPVLQTRVISLFSYALRSGGHLVLGASEGVSAAGPLFNVEDRENKIFAKKASSTRQIVTFSLNRPAEHATDDAPWLAQASRADSNWNSPEWQRDFDRRLLAHYVPPAVFVNEDLEIIHTRDRFDRYFKMPPGRPTLNLLKMAVDDLSVPLQGAILAAKKEKRLVHRKGITLRLPNGKKGASREEVVSLEVVPVKSAMNELCFMIVLLEEDNSQAKGGSRGKRRVDSSSNRYRRLEEELQATKERLQSVVENLEVTNEELQSANEEILSSNEELQSTNEELETAKEELQSTNEELSIVNDELRSRNSLISDAQRDVRDLLTGISVTVVGKDMKVREFAPPARKFLNLLPDDISDLLDANDAPDIPDLYALVRLALQRNGAAPVEVSDRAGRKYRVRVIPYGGSGDKPEGFIVTLTDSSISARLSKRSLPSD